MFDTVVSAMVPGVVILRPGLLLITVVVIPVALHSSVPRSDVLDVFMVAGVVGVIVPVVPVDMSVAIVVFRVHVNGHAVIVDVDVAVECGREFAERNF